MEVRTAFVEHPNCVGIELQKYDFIENTTYSLLIVILISDTRYKIGYDSTKSIIIKAKKTLPDERQSFILDGRVNFILLEQEQNR